MKIIKGIFNNQWVMNIGTGLILYIITTIISKIILNKATNKERQRQIDNANKEIIRILKPYVVNKNILNKMIITSIISSVARKYNLSVNEILDVKSICEELIREILESSYVDNEKKSEYAVYLNDIIESYKSFDDIKERVVLLSESESRLKNYKNIYSLLSFCMMSIVLVISIFVTIFSEKEYEFYSSVSEPIQITMLILIAEIGMMLPAMVLIVKNKAVKYKK